MEEHLSLENKNIGKQMPRDIICIFYVYRLYKIYNL